MRTIIFRSPAADYYADETARGLEIYSDEYLAELVASGMNAIWLHVMLRDVARVEGFEDLARGVEQRQENLRRLSQRAAKHGVRVFLYFCEPRAFEQKHEFWQNHPDLRGAPGTSFMDEWPDTYSICTSHPEAIRFLRESCRDLFSQCPELGGAFLITASEHHTHCYSHAEKPDCPRCSQRAIAEVISEVINTIANGIHAAKPEAEVIAWNWSWPDEHVPAIIRNLDPGVIVMADFERGGWKTVLGKKRFIDEYSLSYQGPSERFLNVYDTARSSGHEVFTKLQVGTTHELATVINLPLIPNLLAKCRWLQHANLPGALACWNFGNRFSLNTFAFTRFLNLDLANLEDDQALRMIANEYLGMDEDAGSVVVEAWRAFARAFDNYPFQMKFLYYGPTNYAPVYPLPRPGDPIRPMAASWRPLPETYGTDLVSTVVPWEQNDATSWEREQNGNSPFTAEETRDAFGRMARIFSQGLALYSQTLGRSTDPRVMRELRNARVISHVLMSTHNIFDAYLLKLGEPFDENAWKKIAAREAAHLEDLPPLLEGETEIGYHIEAQAWFFTADQVRRKVAELKSVI